MNLIKTNATNSRDDN